MREMGRECLWVRERLPLHHYAALEADERRRIETHLTACAPCAETWRATRAALQAVDAGSAFPREAEIDWERLARETVARARAVAADASVAPWWSPSFPLLARLAALVLAFVILGVGTVLVRRAPTPEGRGGAPHARGTEAEAVVSPRSMRRIREGLARQGAARYLLDSRALLIDLVQSPARCRRSGPEIDISLEKARSRDLLRRKNLYERDLQGLEDQRLATLLRQLESLLLQVSSFNDCVAVRQIRDLREEIEHRRILMRIDLYTGTLRGEGASA
ncbi:MAG TPA: zf-HC2 domain-containing protein [Candidatus Polarisedimenticolia bacterium]|nr:zf-HC2 domain-containing protein [Candidatus Polarisedimenticolia bacterium]